MLEISRGINMFKVLANLANSFDKLSLYKAANRVDEIMDKVASPKGEKNPKAALRNRGTVVFPAGSSKVKDDKDHFPINSESQARNALARASQYSKAPPWFKGSLSELVKTVQSKVESKYKGIEVSDKSKKPGKG